MVLSWPTSAVERDVIAYGTRAGVTHLVFVRHANAAPLSKEAPARKAQPHGWKMDDQRRPLTAKGHSQCAAAHDAWFRHMPFRHMLLTSPARRAAETAQLCAAQVETAASPAATLPLLMIESLHPAGQEEAAETLFETRGYGPLRGFYEADDFGGASCFRSYVDRVCLELRERFEQLQPGPEGHVGLFGHAVFLNAVAHAIASAAGCPADSLDLILDMDLGEAQAIVVPLRGSGAVRHVKAT